MSGKRPPKDHRANKAASLLNRFPGLKVPEAMPAVQFSNRDQAFGKSKNTLGCNVKMFCRRYRNIEAK